MRIFRVRKRAIRTGTLLTLAAGLLLLPACVSVSPELGTQWKPANYRGLVVGKATLSDVLDIFGPPTSTEETREGSEPAEDWYFYADQGDFDGELGVFVNSETGVVRKIILST